VPPELVASIVLDDNEDLGLRVALAFMWATAARVGHVTAARISEFDPARTICCRDVEFVGGRVRVHVPTSKGDDLNTGSTLWILPNPGATCPVALLRHYAETMGPRDPDTPFFRRARCSQGFQLSHAEVGQAILRHARRLGVPSAYLTPHGLRVGVATYAASNGLCLQDLLLLGRWKKSSSCLRYLRMTETRAEAIAAAVALPVPGAQPARRHAPLLPLRARRTGGAPWGVL
jgi:integrase